VAAGVAIGLAERLDVPAWVIRLVFVVLTLFGGAGIPLYILGWLFIPNEDEPQSVAARTFSGVDGTRSWIGIALIAIALMIAVSSIGFIRGDLAFALVLVVVGVLLYRGDIGGGTSVVEGTPPEGTTGETDFEDNPPSENPERVESGESTMTLTTEPPAGGTPLPPREPRQPAPPRPRRPKQPPSFLGRLTFGIGLIALGVMAFADYAMTTFDPTARHYFGLAMGIVGLGLLVGTWYGRARSLIVVGVLLVPPLLVSPFVEFGFDGPVGDQRVSPTSLAAVESEYTLAIGELVIDLRDVDFGTGRTELDAQVGIGSLRIILPDGVGAEVEGRVGMGEVDLFGTQRAGVTRMASTAIAGTGTVVIDARTNMGEVVVRSASTAPTTMSGFGNIDIDIAQISELEETYSFDAGDVVIDLSNIDLSTVEFPRSVAIDLSTGDLTVIVDDQDLVDFQASVGVGRLEVFGSSRNGLGLDETYNGDGDAAITFDIEVGAGQLEIQEG
jgi:phage shock protein PspC (stress-responsive transcriptional regulator)/predicted membrane protein